MKEGIVNGLRKLGLTEYEAKAYATLVGMGEATAREVHELCGVPRTRIYDILRDLEKKGFVEFVQGSPTYYRAVEPDLVMERLRSELVASIDRSAKDLKSLSLEAHGSSPVWCIRSEWAIKNRIKDFLDKTEKELTIFCRSPDLLREYRAALKRIEVLKIKVDRTEKFEDLGFATVEMKEGSERFFQDTVIDGVSYSIDGLMISDDRSSIVIGTIGGEKLAIIIKLPIVAMLQKAIWEAMV
ncbi:MAG: TrmB family transcriptional regulator [Methanothrix sp.]|nr:TrmB family transcriptional regulator [Methanothrix sp.]